MKMSGWANHIEPRGTINGPNLMEYPTAVIV